MFLVGTGRVRSADNYAHLFSTHLGLSLIIYAVICLSAIFSVVRLLLAGPALLAPRPAAYFQTNDVMRYELPSFCYGACSFYRYWTTIGLYFVIVLLVNIDFFTKICGYDREEKLKRLLRDEGEVLREASERQEKKEAEPAEAEVARERRRKVFVLVCQRRVPA